MILKNYSLLVAMIFVAFNIQGQNVGIGELVPLQKLHINDDDATIQTIRVEDLADGKEGRLAAPATKTAAAGYRGLVVDGLGDILSMEFDWTIFGNANTNAGGYTGTCPNFTLPGFNNDGTAIPDNVNYAGTSDLTDWVIGSGGYERGRLLRDGQMVFYSKSAKVPSTSPTGCVPAYLTLDAFSVYADGSTYAINAYSEQGPALYGSSERRALEVSATAGDGAFLTGSNNGTLSYADGILTSGAHFRLNPAAGGANMSIFDGISGNGKNSGVYGYAYGSGLGVSSWGGQFEVGNGTTTIASIAVAFVSNNGTLFKVADVGGSGAAVATSRADHTGKVVTLYCPESPSPMYEDYGTAKLVDGKAVVNIDPAFAAMIAVDDSHPLMVFVQLEGDCKGVYVTDKTASGFVVKELSSGNSNVNFSYKIIAHADDVVGPTGFKNNLKDVRFEELGTPAVPLSVKRNAAVRKGDIIR